MSRVPVKTYISLSKVDDLGRIRVYDLEMLPGIQSRVTELWEQVNTDNLKQLTDIEGYRQSCSDSSWQA